MEYGKFSVVNMYIRQLFTVIVFGVIFLVLEWRMTLVKTPEEPSNSPEISMLQGLKEIDVCDSKSLPNIGSLLSKPYDIGLKEPQEMNFTVVILTVKYRTISAFDSLQHYLKMPIVSEVILLWNSPEEAPPDILTTHPENGKRMQIKVQEKNSLWLRFDLAELVKTKGGLLILLRHMLI